MSLIWFRARIISANFQMCIYRECIRYSREYRISESEAQTGAKIEWLRSSDGTPTQTTLCDSHFDNDNWRISAVWCKCDLLAIYFQLWRIQTHSCEYRGSELAFLDWTPFFMNLKYVDGADIPRHRRPENEINQFRPDRLSLRKLNWILNGCFGFIGCGCARHFGIASAFQSIRITAHQSHHT